MRSEPIFMVAAERSGSTLLRLMLDHHPQVAFGAEFDFAIEGISKNNGSPAVEIFKKKTQIRHALEDGGFEIAETDNFNWMVDDLLRQIQSRAGKSYVGATLHGVAAPVLKIWPMARFIHLCRDPRDVATSCIQMGWAGNVWTAVERWILAERAWESLRPGLAEDRYIEVQYENLIRRPREVLEQICRFIGIPFEEAMFGYVDQTNYEVPDASHVEKWRGRLDERQVRLIESRVGDLLELRGYASSQLPPLKVSGMERLKLGMQDRNYRVRHAIRRFGMGLFVSEQISRRLGINVWHDKCLDRIHLIKKSQWR